MCLFRLDLREIERVFGAEGRQGIEASMGPVKDLAADGLVTYDADLLQVTPLGRLFVRNVAMLFDAYLPKRAGGEAPVFSRTV
jgi:oxygen-independent coproporphyrinogen-3 oxidase